MRHFVYTLGTLALLTGCSCRDCDGRYERRPVSHNFETSWDTSENFSYPTSEELEEESLVSSDTEELEAQDVSGES